jgi:hypothetical protein
MRLNGWHRLGIVASVLYAIGLHIYIVYDRSATYQRLVQNSISLCYSTGEFQTKDCAAEAVKYWKDYNILPRWQEELIVTVAPIVLAWLGVYLVVTIIRWIRRGFAGPPAS